MEEIALWMRDIFSGGKVRKETEEGVREREKDVTFRTLPESVGFHAEGGAETLFIV